MSAEGNKAKAIELVEGQAPWIAPSTIFLAYHGSRAYNTYTETSDIDIRGIFVPPLKVISDPYKSPEQVGYHDAMYDVLILDVRKLLKLASQGNPNIIESFWVEKDSWLWTTPMWEKLHASRNVFLTKHVCKRFMGYTLGELRSLKNGLTKPPSATSSRYDLYEKYGYDTKAAMHALRVSRMCKEIVLSGEIIIRRPDADELKRVRYGQCLIEDVISEVQHNLIEARDALDANEFPEHADEEYIKSLSRELFTDSLFGN